MRARVAVTHRGEQVHDASALGRQLPQFLVQRPAEIGDPGSVHETAQSGRNDGSLAVELVDMSMKVRAKDSGLRAPRFVVIGHIVVIGH